MMRKQPHWQLPRTLVALSLCMALQMTGFVMILPLFARRFESFGAGVSAFGISSIAYALTSAIAAPFIGSLADRFGRRPIILLSLLACVLVFSGYLFAISAWMLILLRGLAGLFTAGLVPAIISNVGDLAVENRRAQWIGIVNGGTSIGWVVGPFVGGLLYDSFGHILPFAVSIVLEFAALLLALFFIPETHIPSTQVSRLPLPRMRGLQAASAMPVFVLSMLISFGVMFAWAFIEPEFMFYLYDDLAWTSSQLGLAIGAYGLAVMCGEFAFGRLSDRLGRKPVLLLGLKLFSAQFVGLVMFRDITWITASFILAGLGNALYDPALCALLLDITPPESIARIMGLKGTIGSIGNMLGPGLVVLVTPFVRPQIIFLISAILIFMLTFATGTGLRLPYTPIATRFGSQSAVTRQGE